MNGIIMCLCSIRNPELMYLQGHLCPNERFWGVGVDVNEVIFLQTLSPNQSLTFSFEFVPIPRP
jgi:hypothetical protein